ncbi:MAG: hypothetical protein LBG20_04505 [Holosporaceae bacterium]|nr:hypothetical protein [Holosporaceae bacterium]
MEKAAAVVDFCEEDPSSNCVMHFQNGQEFLMRAIDCRNFTIFEMDLFFKKARIRILDSGFRIEIHRIEKDERFDGYIKLKKLECVSTKLGEAMLHAVNNMYGFLEGKEELLCDISDGSIKYA